MGEFFCDMQTQHLWEETEFVLCRCYVTYWLDVFRYSTRIMTIFFVVIQSKMYKDIIDFKEKYLLRIVVKVAWKLNARELS